MSCEPSGSASLNAAAVCLGAAILVLVLAYLPNLRDLMAVWYDDPSYTHGYLVIPIALFILWQQLSGSAPTSTPKAVPAPWWGWIFLGGALVCAVMYERWSEWSENSTLILAIAGLTWSFGSWPLYVAFGLPLPFLYSCFRYRKLSTNYWRCPCNPSRRRVVGSCCNSQVCG